MSNVNKGIKIFAWITGGLILILACFVYSGNEELFV